MNVHARRRQTLLLVLLVSLATVGCGRDGSMGSTSTEPTGMDLKNRFYLYGQYVGFKLKDSPIDGHALRAELGRSIFGDHTPEATILQAQLFLAGEAQKFQELMGLAGEGAKNPLDTSGELYLDELDRMQLRQLGKFIDDHGESGFAAAIARDQIVKNLNNGPLAVRATYASFFIHRYTIGLETKEEVLARFQELQETASDSRSKEYWKILQQIVQSNESPTDGARPE